jgi:hypothetical protein
MQIYMQGSQHMLTTRIGEKGPILAEKRTKKGQQTSKKGTKYGPEVMKKFILV